MNKLILTLTLTVMSFIMQAQVTKPTATKPAVPLMKNGLDSVSYVLGEIAAYTLMEKGLGDVKFNNAVFSRAMSDILGKKNPLLDDNTANMVLNAYMTKLQAEKNKPTIEEGQKFLAQNKVKPGIKTTASGLQYDVIREGTGIKPAAIDTFVANYRGTLLNGTEFDNSYTRGQPLTLGVGQVIKGWTEGLQLMPIGSKYKFWIPYELAYGTHGQGQIPGGAMLIFEVELLDVKKKQ